MADSAKTRTAAEVDAADQAEIEAAIAVPASAPATGRDAATHAARAAELARQAEIVEAVATAGAAELPALGGPFMEPGLGR
jgi:hypothetical protein